MAEFKVGLGVLFFAPKRRFMMAAAWEGCGFCFEMEAAEFVGNVQEGGNRCVSLRERLVDFVRERWLCLFGGV